ncbi:hypothetical protein MLD38_003749 [Melastoma candidum]|uniref:Uncharacterized protein n=1 Tax=Melastoma candidum TaxID=119954 RepID=A0ACB9S2T6_9MYRT|nr:hypothetical protein MLD38_003749 [Melastoma candidum]
MRVNRALAMTLVVFPVIATLSFVFRDERGYEGGGGGFVGNAHAGVLENLTLGSIESSDRRHDGRGSDLLDGLFAREFDTQKCASRFQSSLIRGASPYKPSSYLISRLRDYEKLHKRCGPRTPAYNQVVRQMKSSSDPGSFECKYVVWISYSGLGNRILTVAAAFLYALLTDRVLLVDPGNDFPDLFCEPFPETSWLLPRD